MKNKFNIIEPQKIEVEFGLTKKPGELRGQLSDHDDMGKIVGELNEHVERQRDESEQLRARRRSHRLL
jgi:hypothetical protein